jgi:hypothetical protein
VPLIQEGEAAPESGPFCMWMPFQKGQVAKVSELESQRENLVRDLKDPPRQDFQGLLGGRYAKHLEAGETRGFHTGVQIPELADQQTASPQPDFDRPAVTGVSSPPDDPFPQA